LPERLFPRQRKRECSASGPLLGRMRRQKGSSKLSCTSCGEMAGDEYADQSKSIKLHKSLSD